MKDPHPPWRINMIKGSEYVGLSDLLDQDISSYEYFHSLPREIQKKIEERDISTFTDMQEYVAKMKDMGRADEI